MRGNTPALPLLAPALHRHLRELPSAANGLSLTEELALTLMAEPPPDWGGSVNLGKIYRTLHRSLDPLPGQGDLHVRDRVLNMEGASARVFERRTGVGPDGKSQPPWTDLLSITELGRAVLKGDADFMSPTPPNRWVAYRSERECPTGAGMIKRGALCAWTVRSAKTKRRRGFAAASSSCAALRRSGGLLDR
jgi:hypothetical protein